MDYNPQEYEPKWQRYWQDSQVYRAEDASSQPKCYVLDMFPYPSGAGLHVGHPLGYIATDIFSRFKKLKGYNVLHPMGFDSFGLPAEQYAIETGQHPALTTAENIDTFKAQLAKIGFNYDWNREIRTSNPDYYRWTQWIFIQIFESYFDKKEQKAKPISQLIALFEKEGNANANAACNEDTPLFTAHEWQHFSEKEQSDRLMHYRLAYLADAYVNWCPALGMVLANDEVKDGLSERGGHPVERKLMKQWMMRITAYADRLLENLEDLQWSDALKEMQRNWIGKSYGCEIDFELQGGVKLTAFTTRIDTIYGVTYLALAPELEIISELTTAEQQQAVAQYVAYAKNRSERERQAEVKTVSGVFTGSYALNPFSGAKVPIWVADYVLSGYGTGVVMGVPASDERDFRFATHFNLPIVQVLDKTQVDENGNVVEAYSEKEGKMVNSAFLDGLEVKEAIQKAIEHAESQGVGKGKVNFRLRDAAFSRQRYWGEPMPIYYQEGIPKPLKEEELPLLLPTIDEYRPTADGQPPLARAKDWKYKGKYEYETTTMPGWAGSSWYFLRYQDPDNRREFAARSHTDYWNQVDLYVGGTEHAVGHLLYSRFWTQFLYDRGHIAFKEPFKRLVNQGMIQGKSSLIYRLKEENKYISADLVKNYTKEEKENLQQLHVWIELVENDTLNIAKYKKWRSEAAQAEFVFSKDGNFYCDSQVEKMSKRLHNVVNPDDIVRQYSADTLRLYEMFLGPLEFSKPWDTSGIEGVSKFLRKVWRLFYDRDTLLLTEEAPTEAELKVLHKTIKKIEDDIERLSFNTAVSGLMICVNELQDLKCHKRAILEPFLVLLSPLAPHLCEELWQNALGKKDSIVLAKFPTFEARYLVENQIEYPISINGKVRDKITLAADISAAEAEKIVLQSESVQKWLEGKSPKKFIFVPKRIINLVV
ncbi:leucine--tRNA ligase [Hugenholtzia roseola]|uniref:leucine--tRNA ligase n=1 Tax=Hugenholtzia roseola TaxID=1002 RepID=UPI00047DC2F9|nr:leucine--tRNA ligase [Hugenholtzia roseola]